MNATSIYLGHVGTPYTLEAKFNMSKRKCLPELCKVIPAGDNAVGEWLQCRKGGFSTLAPVLVNRPSLYWSISVFRSFPFMIVEQETKYSSDIFY